MTDRELLELAAKAAGYKADFTQPYEIEIDSTWIEWDPLTDNGDALRLAVDLSLDVECLNFATQVNYDIRGNLYHCNVRKNEGSCNGDLYAATRRAIVIAAAEIGKTI